TLPDDLGVDVRHLEIQPLTGAETASLAARRLGGAVSPQLAEELMALSAGNPDVALETLARWGADGRITATATGLGLAAAETTTTADSVEPLLARVIDRLSPAELEVLSLA